MKLTLRHLGIRSTDALDSWIERQVLSLRSAMRIDEAVLHLRHSRETSPAYRVDAHLVTPGLDVMAEASDHTLRAALQKLLRQLRSKIDQRDRKRLRRLKGNLSAPAETTRGAARR